MKGIAIKLAIFTLITASVTLLLASVIGNFKPWKPRYTLEAVFDDVTGLLKGDLVTLAGVEVGKVRDGRVEDGYAVVVLRIDREVQLPKTAQVNIRYRNLIGQRVVELEPGEGGLPYFEHGDRVPVEQTDGPLDLDTVFNNLRPLVTGIEAADVNTLSKMLVELGSRKEDIDSIFADAATLTGELAERDQRIASLVSNLDGTVTALASERQQLTRLLRNLAGITEVLADNSGALDRTLTNLDQALGDFAALIEGNRPALDQDLGDLATLLDILARRQADLNQITRSLDDTLRATFKVQTYGEWNNLFIFSLCIDENPFTPGCRAPVASSASIFRAERGLETIMYGAVGGRR